MKDFLRCSRVILLLVFVTVFNNSMGLPKSLLVEAESFQNKGGWVVDQQFIPSMGSPYLLAHGMGKPVANASTNVEFPAKGKYSYWVRTKDWVASHPEAPGIFKIEIDGEEQKTVFGTNEYGWQWVLGGTINISDTNIELQLKDLTGFEGRCDAIYFSSDKNDFPPNELDEMEKWRSEKLGLAKPVSAGNFNLVVVGGGISGCAAAVAAARNGLKVALINDRPVLGGNASKEVRVHTLGIPFYRIVEELNTTHYPNGDATAIPTNDTIHDVISNEKNIHLFLNTFVNDVEKSGNKITSVFGINTINSKKSRFEGRYFVDATGDGWVGYYAGAEFLMGREAKNDFNESMAPDKGDGMTMGNSVLWNSYDAGVPSSFPEVPWAMEVAKDYNVKAGEWFWEYGMHLNTIYDAEEIRDHLFRAIYGTWANVKADPANSNLELKWVAYIAGKRESRRILGHYILKEEDVVNHIDFKDGFVEEVREIDIHYPQPGKYDFISYADFTEIEQYEIPYRCLVSKDISNLFMAGRCFSATHVGLGSPRVMNTLGQMGVVVGTAASVCKSYECSPIDVYYKFLEQLESSLSKLRIRK